MRHSRVIEEKDATVRLDGHVRVWRWSSERMTAHKRGAAKVLVVDDSAMSRRIMRRILDDAGHTVIEAADGASALASYELERPALVTLDLIMAGMDGLQVLIELRRRHPLAQVIIATADLQIGPQ